MRYRQLPSHVASDVLYRDILQSIFLRQPYCSQFRFIKLFSIACTCIKLRLQKNNLVVVQVRSQICTRHRTQSQQCTYWERLSGGTNQSTQDSLNGPTKTIAIYDNMITLCLHLLQDQLHSIYSINFKFNLSIQVTCVMREYMTTVLLQEIKGEGNVCACQRMITRKLRTIII